jgi:Ran GTPase-activating protein (RanGAP) involved in mRNA processing and transport
MPSLIANKYGNKTNVVELDKAIDYFSKRFMEKLAKKYQENEVKMKDSEDIEFKEFERKRDGSCKQGRCEYITRIIDEFEGARPKSDEF